MKKQIKILVLIVALVFASSVNGAEADPKKGVLTAAPKEKSILYVKENNGTFSVLDRSDTSATQSSDDMETDNKVKYKVIPGKLVALSRDGIREEASPTSAIIMSLSKGDTINYNGEQEGFYSVINAENAEVGWVLGRVVEVVKRPDSIKMTFANRTKLHKDSLAAMYDSLVNADSLAFAALDDSTLNATLARARDSIAQEDSAAEAVLFEQNQTKVQKIKSYVLKKKKPFMLGSGVALAGIVVLAIAISGNNDAGNGGGGQPGPGPGPGPDPDPVDNGDIAPITIQMPPDD
ncbi:MAG: hypothetical protein A2268_12465 [Candidatus Raymondbacteria bacterium RifOxyA12_full_50_37]|uniref:SH3b domain-containing protein n=1 Tax=Candidatus Raymondbacteria bacterium RIFOXYD12_FULL_49_13 TaxID=1817890 RepID=A0A1F7FI39_UNCRA|nr:MAG: hypothetical protein A2268_12465 [Candidatus Raymondbacteria bacterium RifOxyA12_full_50_37]OGJ91351.1 MAG: hypothetical protein A2248_03960 [Candidatus Raymondbacteria bacterium RIFOXYA2_FULL_49_16]OGJ97744.1 MAG: hypothetical protein A2453_13760 [Candidatus Raymondbacteria bacterium RIFOXYC2_FULL_50_21]OGK00154.1 MAG: hypothetical protein A2487_09570 [Candidatus Raymondbacteria bacterium RifOxyC12_full_50_8]OGK06394.1 MAG: hypothetical protein A2519_11905 [Candidatus Raymondbacteria b